MREVSSEKSVAKKSYPGQCVHDWVPTQAQPGQKRPQACARGCGSTCSRDERGKVSSYAAGRSLVETPPEKLSRPRSAPRRAARPSVFPLPVSK